MSKPPFNEVDTPWGQLRWVRRDGEMVWKLCCPQCGHWGEIDDDQLHGRVSLDHTNCGISYSPSECQCTWHETHDYTTVERVAFMLRLQRRITEDKAILDRLATRERPA